MSPGDAICSSEIFFFSACWCSKPIGLLLDTLRAKLGQKVASQGQPLSKGAHLWLAELHEGTTIKQEAASETPEEASRWKDLQFCLRRMFKVASGGLQVLIPGLCGSVLQSRCSPAEQCGVHKGRCTSSALRCSLDCFDEHVSPFWSLWP